VMTLQKPFTSSAADGVRETVQASAQELIQRALTNMPHDRTRNPSHVYATILRDAIQRQQAVDHLHLGDVLVALRNAGYGIDPKTGMLASVDGPFVAAAAE